MINFSSQLEYYMSMSGMSRSELSERMGLHQSYISNLLIGRRAPSVAVCNLLDSTFKTQSGFWEKLAREQYGTVRNYTRRIPNRDKIQQMLDFGMDAMQISNNLCIPLTVAQEYVQTIRKQAQKKHADLTGQKSVPMSMIPTIVPPLPAPHLSNVVKSYEYDVTLSVGSAHICSDRDFVTITPGISDSSVQGTINYDNIQRMIDGLRWIQNEHKHGRC